ncbi:MAG: PadR family transcriptional regulator [bacterium]|nr:PadR family transcriptional regulator [bacterium]
MSLPHMIMGLLTWNSFTGYDLNKLFQQTVQYFWWTEQSQIYRALHRMERDGWVNVETIIQQDNPNRKVYHLTETGRAELLRWLAEPHHEDHPHEVWVGKLFFSHLLPNEDLIHLFEIRLAQTEGLLSGLEERQAFVNGLTHESERSAILQKMTVGYGVEMLRAERDWMRRQLDILRGMPDQPDSNPHS